MLEFGVYFDEEVVLEGVVSDELADSGWVVEIEELGVVDDSWIGDDIL